MHTIEYMIEYTDLDFNVSQQLLSSAMQPDFCQKVSVPLTIWRIIRGLYKSVSAATSADASGRIRGGAMLSIHNASSVSATEQVSSIARLSNSPIGCQPCIIFVASFYLNSFENVKQIVCSKNMSRGVYLLYSLYAILYP